VVQALPVKFTGHIRALARVEHLPPIVVGAVYGLSALIVPLTSGAFWPLAVAPRVERAFAVKFMTDAISSLPIEGVTWVVQPWLTVLLLDAADRLGGVGALAALAGILAFTLGVLLYLIARRSTPPLFAAGVVLVVLPLLFPLLLQGQLLATICAAMLVLTLLTGRWWYAPLIVVLWTNVHGSAVIGAMICGLAYLGTIGTPALPSRFTDRLPALATIRGRTIWFAVCCACVLATPLGFGLVEYVRDVSGIPHLASLTPIWRPLHPFEWRFIAVVGTALVTIAALVRHPEGRRRFRILVPLLVFAAMTLHAERNIAWFAVMLCAALAVAVQRWIVTRSVDGELRSGVVGVTLIVVMVMGIAGLWPGTHRQKEFSLAALPVGLLVSLDDDSRVYSSIEWADYTREVTGASVYLDARLERFSEHDLRDYLDAIQGKGAALDSVLKCSSLGEPMYTHILLRDKTAHKLIGRIEEIAADHNMEARELASNDDGALFALDC
jgi:hypothetical protein